MPTKGRAGIDPPITAESPTGSTALEVVTLKVRCPDPAVGLDLWSRGPQILRTWDPREK